MARARNIKPGFFENEDLAECSAHSRLLFIGLWQLADRRGVLEDRPRRIGGAIFRYESVDCDALLTELSERGFILRYQVGETRCIFIPKFGEHQNPHVKEQANNLPLPDQHQTSMVQAPDEHHASHAESLLPLTESLLLNPESGVPPLPPKGDEDEPDDEPGSFYTVDFEQFWTVYPRKKKKGDAFRAWKRAKGRPPVPILIESIERQKRSTDWTKDNGDYIPYPASWINGRSWEDEVEVQPSPDDLIRAWERGAAAVAPELLRRVR